MPRNTLSYSAILGTAAILLAAAPAPAQSIARDLFDDSTVQNIYVDLAASDWEALRAHYLENTYYHARVAWNGLVSGDIGIRSRGRGSRSPEKPNIDVNIDKYVKKQTFAGLGFFVLKANNQDASLVRENITFKLFRRMGLTAPREAPARLYINGEYFGLYTVVERNDEDLLDRNLGESAGDLFEWKPNAVYHFEFLGDDPALYSPQFLDPKTNEDNPDIQKFIEMAKVINQSPDSEFINNLSPYLDPKLYLTHVAVETVAAEIDGLWADTYGMNNFYIYRYAGQQRFQFLPWDKDITFHQAEREVFQSAEENVLARRLLAIPEYRDAYLAEVNKAAGLLGGPGGWADQEVNRLYFLVREDAVNDPHKQCTGDDGVMAPCGPADFEAGIQAVHSFIAVRGANLRQQLDRLGFQPQSSAPVIDLVSMASPQTGRELVPGAVVRVYGARLGDDVYADRDPLPRNLRGTFASVNGVRAAMVAVAPGQAEFQIPPDIPPGPAAIALNVWGQFSNTIIAEVVASAPEILAVVHQDGTPVSAAAPVLAEEKLTMYAVGLGEVRPMPPPGAVAHGPEWTSVEKPAIQVGSTFAEVTYAGLAPFDFGIYQVNFTLPAGLEGDLSLFSITQAGRSASANF